MLKLTTILLLLTGFCLNTQAQTAVEASKSITSYSHTQIPTNTLDRFIEREMASLKIPGLSMAIINDGKLAYHQVYGYANLKDSISVTSSTIFEGASISKSLFAYFVMKTVEIGKIGLDVPLHHYLPKDALAHDARYKEITARMVLNHTTGLPNWRENTADKKLTLSFKPGSNFLYSGEAYQYLAEVMAQVYETDIAGLEKVFQSKVAQPLGMENSFFIENNYTRKHKAEPYKNGGQIDWKNSYWYKKDKGKFVAASSLLTESKDFSKFIIALINKVGLGDDSFSYLLEPQVALPDDHPLRAYGINHWTLGFHRLETPLGTLIGHGGDNEGFESLYHFDVEKQWGFVVFTNSDGGTELAIKLNQFLMTGP